MDVSRETNPAVKEDELYHAFKLARKHFADVKADDVLSSLELCQENGGLFVAKDILFAFLRYDPRQLLDQMEDFNLAELSKRDLSNGPCVHVCAFVCPHNGAATFRQFINALNPYLVSVHRLRKRSGERVFTMKKHVRHRI